MGKAKKIIVRWLPYLIVIFAWLIFCSPYIRGLVPIPTTYLVSFFAPWNATGGMPVKNNAMPDIITQIMPWKSLTIDMWKNGEIPLWNPFSFSGTPHAANYQSAVFHPTNLLYFVFPFVNAWSIQILLQPLLAGIGMVLLLRVRQLPAVAATIGGIAFMFCGFMVVWMAYGTLGYAVLVLPYILYCIARFEKTKHMLWGAAVSFLIAQSFYAGHFQMSVYVLLYTIAYVVYISLAKRSRSLLMSLGIFISIGIVLALPQLWLSFDAFAESYRKANFVRAEIIPWQYLLTFLAPDFYGNPVTRNDWFGHYAEWAGFIGVVPLILVFYGLRVKHIRMLLFFWIIAIVSLLAALPSPVSTLLFELRIPVLSTSAASRIIILASFSFIIIAAHGAAILLDDWSRGVKKNVVLPILLSVITLLFLWGSIYMFPLLPAEAISVARRNSILPTLLTVVTLALIVAPFFFRKKGIVVVVLVLLLGLHGVDMLRFVTKWMPADPANLLYPATSVGTFLKDKANPDRVFGNIGGEFSIMHSLPLIEGYDALYNEQYGKFIGSAKTGALVPVERSIVMLDKNGVNSERILRFLGVEYLVHRKSDGRNIWAYPYWKYDSYTQIYEDENFEVLENNGALPRAYAASTLVVESDPQKIIDTLFNPEFDMGTTAIVEESVDTALSSTDDATVEIVSYKPTKVEIKTTLASGAFVVLTDSYDKGWKALVDGVPTSIYRTNFAFRGLFVPSGIHTIVMEYRPNGIIYGLPIAISMGVILLLFVGKYTYDHRYL